MPVASKGSASASIEVRKLLGPAPQFAARAMMPSGRPQHGLLGAVWTTAAEVLAAQVCQHPRCRRRCGAAVRCFKKSGYGREKGYQALDMFTATKTVVVRLWRTGAPVRFVSGTNPGPQAGKGERPLDHETYQRGLEIRSAVLGAAYVSQALAGADDFTKPPQDLITEYCWGAVWGRDGLALKTRSMLTLAMISVLNRPNELRTHINAALTNGVTRDEVREIFLQVAIYAGVPAAVDSFRVAR